MPPFLQVAGLVAVHLSDGGKEECEQVQEVMAIPNQRAPNEVMFGVVLPMMKDIMGGNDPRGRVRRQNTKP